MKFLWSPPLWRIGPIVTPVVGRGGAFCRAQHRLASDAGDWKRLHRWFGHTELDGSCEVSVVGFDHAKQIRKAGKSIKGPANRLRRPDGPLLPRV
ncbi:MAG: hypothetical protein ACOCWX_01690, partial [Spirochaetota bacterium]